MPPTPHDALFKTAFSQPDLARSELELVLPPAIRGQLDLTTLEVCDGTLVNDEQRETRCDLLFRVATCAGSPALVYVLFEHQSSFDARMPLRLLGYMLGIWERWQSAHPSAKLPPIIPVVLHHGDDRWHAAPELASMLDASPEVLAAVGPYQPLFHFVLDDLSALSVDALAQRPLSRMTLLVELALWASRSLRRIERAAPHLRPFFALALDDPARSLRTIALLYLLDTAPSGVEGDVARTILLDVAGPKGREEIVTYGEQLIEQGREQGREQGLEQGRASLRASLVAAFAARAVPLSEPGRARIAACSDLALLTTWLTRALTASSEAAVFA